MKIEIGYFENWKWEEVAENKKFINNGRNFIIEVLPDGEIINFLSRLMREYRGRGVTYNYIKGQNYEDADEYEGYGIGIKIDDKQIISYSNFGGYRYQATCRGIDIRRLVAEIINYCKENNIKISSISMGDKKYSNISDINIKEKEVIQFLLDLKNYEVKKNKYIYIETGGNDRLEICFPYLTYSDLYSGYRFRNTKKVYFLKDAKTNVYHFKLYNIENNWVDLFRGFFSVDRKKLFGEFYYVNDRLVPHFAVYKNKETGKVEYYYSNIFDQVENIEVLKFVNSENIEILDENYNTCHFDDIKVFYDEKNESAGYDILDINSSDINDKIEQLIQFILKNIIFSPVKIERDGLIIKKKDEEGNIYIIQNEKVDASKSILELNQQQYNLAKFDFVFTKCEVNLQNNYYFIIDLPRAERGYNYFCNNKWYLKNINYRKKLVFNIKNTDFEIGFTFDELLNLSSINSNYSRIGEILKSLCDENTDEWFFTKENSMKNIMEICQYFENLSTDEIKDLQSIASSISIEEINEKSEIRKILYDSDKSIVDEKVVNTIYYMVKEYRLNGCIDIPNFAIMGDPGTGKTSLAEKIARCFIQNVPENEKIVSLKTPADLKGEYVGQSQRRVFEVLKEVIPTQNTNAKVVLIDEAYNLGKDDAFGKEIVTMLLNILSGDRHEFSVEYNEQKDENKDACIISWATNTTPNIWFSGYKTEMLNMLQNNPGLSSRMHEIILPTPSVEQLFEYLCLLCDDKLKIIVEKEANTIKSFIGWATRPEYKYTFANYRGIKNFYDGFKTRFLSIDINNTKMIKIKLEEYIVSQEYKIKEYYKAKIAEKEKNDFVFEVLTDIKETFDSYKGNKKVVAEMKNIVDLLFDAKKYSREGIEIPKGALLVGPPGTGKTLLAKVVASELQKKYYMANDKNKKVGFIPVSGAELCGYNGEKVKKLFSIADEYDSAIIFIDEIDGIGTERRHNAYGQDLTQLMIAMDGFEKRKSLFVMAATNAPESLDPALKRPGRFDKIIEISNLADENDVVDIMLFYLQKLKFLDVSAYKVTDEMKKMADDLQLSNYEEIKSKYNVELVEFIDELKKNLYGSSPAQIKNYINKASILHKEIENKKIMLNDDEAKKLIKKEYPYRRTDIKDSTIKKFKEDILEILEQENIGELKEIDRKNKEFLITENEGYVATALHEVGHAVASIILYDVEPFEKITIRPRGNAAGYVVPKASRKLNTKSQYLKEIQVCLAGRAVEDIFYNGDVSVGAIDDIKKATYYVKCMVENFGFSMLGVMAMSAINNNYLNDNNTMMVSDEYMAKVDMEVNRIINTQYEEIKKLLSNNKYMIEQLAKYVYDETIVNDKLYITGEEFKKKYEEIKIRS